MLCLHPKKEGLFCEVNFFILLAAYQTVQMALCGDDDSARV